MKGPLLSSLEYRGDKAYDEQTPATVIHPNGSLMLIGARNDDLAMAITREVLTLHHPGTSWSRKAVA